MICLLSSPANSTKNYELFFPNHSKREMAGWLGSLGYKDGKKKITIGVGFLLMYTGFILLLLPMIISAWPVSLTLSNTPQTFDFEDGLTTKFLRKLGIGFPLLEI